MRRTSCQPPASSLSTLQPPASNKLPTPQLRFILLQPEADKLDQSMPTRDNQRRNSFFFVGVKDSRSVSGPWRPSHLLLRATAPRIHVDDIAVENRHGIGRSPFFLHDRPKKSTRRLSTSSEIVTYLSFFSNLACMMSSIYMYEYVRYLRRYLELNVPTYTSLPGMYVRMYVTCMACSIEQQRRKIPVYQVPGI